MEQILQFAYKQVLSKPGTWREGFLCSHSVLERCQVLVPALDTQVVFLEIRHMDAILFPDLH